jgi:virginiamycin B lyase
MNRRARSGAARALAAVLAWVAIGSALAPPSRGVTIAQHTLPGGASGAIGIAAAPGGLAITRAEQSTTVLQRISTAPFAAGAVQPVGATALATGPDGQLWLLAVTGAAGTVALEREPAAGAPEQRFAFPLALGPGFWPEQFVLAPDGSVWIANITAGAIERLAPGGALSSYPLPRAGAPTSIALAPDGGVWVTELATGTIGELGAGGTVTEHALAGAAPAGFGNAEPYSIAVGPDGALWFTEQALGRIGRISRTGGLQEFAIPNASGVAQGEYGSPAPRFIAAGPDGALWFTDGGDESIGRITTTGQVSEYPIGTRTPASPQGIVSQGGELWFAEAALDALGSVDPNGSPAPPPAAASSRPRAAARKPRCGPRRRSSRRRSAGRPAARRGRSARGPSRGCVGRGAGERERHRRA